MATVTVIPQTPQTAEQEHGVNAAVAESVSDFVMLVGAGIIPAESCVCALLAYAVRRPKVGAVTGLLLAEDGSVHQAGLTIGPDHLPRPLYHSVSVAHPAVNQARRMQLIGTELTLVRGTAWNDIGGLDESLVGAYLDVDFCMRLRAFGWEAHVCPEGVGQMRMKPRTPEPPRLAASERVYRQKWAGHVIPDEFQYYGDDGLLRFEQHMLYPLEIELQPPLSIMPESTDDGTAVEMLHALSQRMQEMVHDNIRMKSWCVALDVSNGKVNDMRSDRRT